MTEVQARMVAKFNSQATFFVLFTWPNELRLFHVEDPESKALELAYELYIGKRGYITDSQTVLCSLQGYQQHWENGADYTKLVC